MKANVHDGGRASDAPQLDEPGKPASRKNKAPARTRSAAWLIAGLLVLSAVPLAFGAFVLAELAGVAEIMPPKERFHAPPLPVVLHIVGAAVYCILGAFQFTPGLRRRWPGWHRARSKQTWRKLMKAIVYTKYGSPDVLNLEEIEKPIAV